MQSRENVVVVVVVVVAAAAAFSPYGAGNETHACVGTVSVREPTDFFFYLRSYVDDVISRLHLIFGPTNLVLER